MRKPGVTVQNKMDKEITVYSAELKTLNSDAIDHSRSGLQLHSTQPVATNDIREPRMLTVQQLETCYYNHEFLRVSAAM